MRSISGLIPYQELSKTAKYYGGPENYICKVYSSGYNAGLRSAGKSLAFGIVLYFGIRYVYKQVKNHKDKKEFSTWTTD